MSDAAVTLRAGELNMSIRQHVLALRNDPVFFAREVWEALNLNRYGRLRRFERRMIRFACLGPRKRGILAPRGLGKTYFCALITAAWHLFRNPDSRILFVSKSIGHAKKSIHELKNWIRLVPFLRHLYANNVKGKRWGAFEIDVLTAPHNRTPSVTAMGIEGALPGNRASLVIADDIETDVTAKTADGRANVEYKTREFANIATYGNQEILYVGTFFHDDSIYCRLACMKLEEGPDQGKNVYTFKTWPILAPTMYEASKMLGLDEQVQMEIAAGTLKPGDKLFPRRHSDRFIAEQKAHGPTHWYRQYMLIPGVMDELYYPLKLRDLIVFELARDIAPINFAWGVRDNDNSSTVINDITMAVSDATLHRPIYWDKQWAPYQRTIMWLDPAGTGTDHTALTIAATLNAFIFWKEARNFPKGQGYADETLNAIAHRARYHRVSTIFIEKNFGMGMYTPLLMPYLRRLFLKPGEDPEYPDGWSCSVQEEHTHGGRQAVIKEVRICDALEGPVTQHRIVVDRAIAENPEFQHQFARITRQPKSLKNDDLIESAAMATVQLKDTISRDPDQATNRYREEMQHRQWELEEQEWTDEPTKEPRWFQHH